MRTPISTYSLVLLLLAVTATIPSAVNATPCEDCIFAGIYATSPTCDPQIFTNPFQGGVLTERQKACFCPLASSNTWLQQCITPDLCTTKDVNDQYGGFNAMKADVCSSTGAPSTATTTGGGTKPPSSSTATSTSTAATSTSTGAGMRLDSSSKLTAIAVVAAVGALI